ncbi:RNA polymerase-associated protein LEO1-like isoform X2 [Amphiprion ocellaris]|nr:RNA polymerase-associated protein LEO1-like isoform X2 [Amphiprion ocellaris]
MLTEESLLSSHSGSDVDYKPSSSPSSREDEVLAQESHSSCYSSPEKHHRHLPSSDTEIGYFTSTFQDGEQLFTTSSSAQRQKKTVTRRRHDEDDDDSDGEVPYSAAARSLVKRQWQTARRHGEDDGGADEDDGSDNTSQVGGMQQDTNRGPQKMTTAKEKHDDDDDDDDSDDDVSDDKTGPGTENTDGVVRQETAGRPLVKQKERTTEKHDDDDRQEPHSTSGSSAVDKPKRIATTRQDDGDDEDSGDSEHDEKDRKRVKRRKKAAHKQKRQQDNDDSDGEDRQTTATGSPRKDQKKTAVTRECSDTDAPEMEVKKQGKRPWNERERTAVKRHLGKFIALQKVPTKQDCLMCIDKESSVLRARRWTDVKYFVYNEIVKIKRKPAF